MQKVLPNESIVETKFFHLSTKSSSGTILNQNPAYKSAIRFNIPDAIVRDESIDYIQFSIPYVVIPNSFYNINESNNTLIIRLYNDYNNYQIITTLIPIGNYNVQTFMTVFRNSLGNSGFTISFNSTNNLITINHNQYDFSLDASSTIDYIIGFSGLTLSVNQSLEMPRVCNFLPLPRIVIRCPELGNGYLDGENDIILTIPNTARPNGQIVDNSSGLNKSIFKLDMLNSITLFITDDEGNLINFNGVSSFMTFQFDLHRRFLEKPLQFNAILDMVNSGHGVRPF